MLSKLSNSNKKLGIVVALLALVAGIVTIYSRGDLRLGGFYLGTAGRYPEVVTQEARTYDDAGMIADQKMMVEPSMGMYAPDIYPYPYPGNNALDVADRLYQKYSYHGVVVDDVPAYLRSMREYVLSVGGKVLSSEQGEDSLAQYGYLNTKVPVDKFEETTIRATENVKKVANESISSQDVTGQAESLDEQMQQLEDERLLLEAQLVDASTEVERRRLELQIQRLDNQISNLQNRQEGVSEDVEYATVSITAADDARYYDPNVDPSLRQELEDAWNSAKDVLRLVLVLGIWVTVYAVIWLPLILILRWAAGRFTRKRTE